MALFQRAPIQGSPTRRRRRGLGAVLATAVVAGALTLTAGPAAAASGSLTGTLFVDANRDGVQQADEATMADQRVYLYDGAGAFLASRLTSTAGTYSFADLPDGEYRVEVQWAPLREDWVPTTTATLFPRVSVTVNGAATVPFGFRRIQRSTDPSAPMSSFTGPNGLRTASYNDVVPARELYDAILRGLVGPEAATVTVRFGLDSASSTATSVTMTDGRYSNFSAAVAVTYTSWLDHGDYILSHEYGHAWSSYHAYITQQDPSLSGYLKVRGLEGDTRLNTSHSWNSDELIAEDYRTLFGSPTASAVAQENGELPPAADVPGLREYLHDTFTTAAAPTPQPTASPTPEPSPSPSPSPAPSKPSKGGGTKSGGGKR